MLVARHLMLVARHRMCFNAIAQQHIDLRQIDFIPDNSMGSVYWG